MKRILVIGSSGAGKSSLAHRLGKGLELPVYHLDKLFWKPGWNMTPTPQWRQTQTDLVKKERWIIDGTYDGTLDVRIPRADTIIHLLYPRRICMWRALKRILSTYGKTRPDLGPGCPEKFDLEFIRWVWRYHKDITPNILNHLDQCRTAEIITLTNPGQTARFMQALEAKSTGKTRP